MNDDIAVAAREECPPGRFVWETFENKADAEAFRKKFGNKSDVIKLLKGHGYVLYGKSIG